MEAAVTASASSALLSVAQRCQRQQKVIAAEAAEVPLGNVKRGKVNLKVPHGKDLSVDEPRKVKW